MNKKDSEVKYCPIELEDNNNMNIKSNNIEFENSKFCTNVKNSNSKSDLIYSSTNSVNNSIDKNIKDPSHHLSSSSINSRQYLTIKPCKSLPPSITHDPKLNEYFQSIHL